MNVQLEDARHTVDSRDSAAAAAAAAAAASAALVHSPGGPVGGGSGLGGGRGLGGGEMDAAEVGLCGGLDVYYVGSVGHSVQWDTVN